MNPDNQFYPQPTPSPAPAPAPAPAPTPLATTPALSPAPTPAPQPVAPTPMAATLNQSYTPAPDPNATWQTPTSDPNSTWQTPVASPAPQPQPITYQTPDPYQTQPANEYQPQPLDPYQPLPYQPDPWQQFQDQATQPEPKGRDIPVNRKKITIGIISGFAVLLVIAFGIFGIGKLISSNSEQKTDPSQDVSNSATGKPSKITLQHVVDKWLTSENAATKAGVLIYDLDNATIVGRNHESDVFDMAQLYQLFIAYEGYDRIARGVWTPESPMPSLPDLTHAECLDRTLRYSDVGCSDALWDEIGRDALQSSFNARDFSTDIGSFNSTPSEIMRLLQLYYNHPNLSDEIYSTILDALLNQSGNPDTENENLRQGLPSGFSIAKVYNKSGWYKTMGVMEEANPVIGIAADGTTWHTFDDAAIVEFPETTNADDAPVPARHYIIVVLTHDTLPKSVASLARDIETTIHTSDGY